MAIAPSQAEIDRQTAQNQAEFQAKAEAQALECKTFNVAADGHGPGVVPEAIWNGQKVDQV